MPPYAYGVLLAAWLIWLVPFFLARRKEQKAVEIDRRARWGMILQAISYSLLWPSRFWKTSPPPGRMVASVFFFAMASALSWTGARALGRQWRLDAGLNADHELVTWGPYRLVRHPIYTSMLCMLLAAGSLVTPLPLLLAAVMVMIIGTEIRVRAEERLLGERFGERFRQYRSRVSAYVPWLR